MAVDPHHTGDTALSSSLFLLPDKNNNNHGSSSALKPPLDKDDDFIKELTHHMAHFTLEDDDTFDFSDIGSHTQNFEPSSWDFTGSPQSTLWSPMGYNNQGSSEGSSSQEPSPPATPGNDQDSCCVFENMKKIQSSNIGLCSYQTLIQEQIRAIELSRLKQEYVLPPKQNPVHEPRQEIHEFQKKGNGRRRTRPPRPAPLQTSSGMRAVFLGGSGSRGGTGVFLPRGGTCATSDSESTNKQEKGCSTVLIPARVVQALQLHFDKTAAMSAPKVVGFPLLRDLIVSDRDGMYSLQSTKAPKDVQNDQMILPQEWTY